MIRITVIMITIHENDLAKFPCEWALGGLFYIKILFCSFLIRSSEELARKIMENQDQTETLRDRHFTLFVPFLSLSLSLFLSFSRSRCCIFIFHFDIFCVTRFSNEREYNDER